MTKPYHVYIGTYTDQGSKGIYRCAFSPEKGELGDPELVAEMAHPSFLAIDRKGQHLYATSECEEGNVTAWSIPNQGPLISLGKVSTSGEFPCHLSLDMSERTLLVANYGGSSVATFPVHSNGSIGEQSGYIPYTGSSANPVRQEKPHPHAVYTDPSNTFAYVCDLGTDEVKIYHFNCDQGTLTPSISSPCILEAGSGPRHLAFHPNGCVYIANELSATISVCRSDTTTGGLSLLQTVSALPSSDSNDDVASSEIAIHPSGKWLYISNRGHESLAVFSINSDASLTLQEHVTSPKEPRSFALSPEGEWLLVGGQHDNTLAVFSINLTTGRLTHTGHTIAVNSPACILIAPVG
jgi:6-phosphogluconolactonase